MSSAVINRAEVKALRSYSEKVMLSSASDCTPAILSPSRMTEGINVEQRRRRFEELRVRNGYQSFEASCSEETPRFHGAAEVFGVLRGADRHFRRRVDQPAPDVAIEVDFTSVGVVWLREERNLLEFHLDDSRSNLELNGGAAGDLLVVFVIEGIQAQFADPAVADRLRSIEFVTPDETEAKKALVVA